MDNHNLRIKLKIGDKEKHITRKDTAGYRLIVRDENGECIYKGEFKSFTKNFLNLLYGVLGFEGAYIKDVTGVDKAVEQDGNFPWLADLGGQSDGFGLFIGSGSNTVTSDDFFLNTFSKSDGVHYTGNYLSGVTDDTDNKLLKMTFSREIMSLNSTVTVGEAGLVFKAGEEEHVLVARDTFSPTVTIAKDKKRTFVYELTLGYDDTEGGFVKGFWGGIQKEVRFYQNHGNILPVNKSYLSAVVFNNKIWAIGGYGDSVRNVLSSEDGINWTNHENILPVNKSYLSAVVFNNKIWAIGGSGQEKNVLSSEDGINWTNHGNILPVIKSYLSAVVFNNKIWAIGGYGGPEKNVLSSEDGINWTNHGNILPVNKSDLSAVVFNNKIWAIGGSGQEKNVLSISNKSLLLNPTLNTDTHGIQVGSGTTAYDSARTALATRIPAGTGSGQLIYESMQTQQIPTTSGNTTVMNVSRIFENSTANPITIKEVALTTLNGGMLALFTLKESEWLTLQPSQSEAITISLVTEV